jgi:hypothetical protein
MRRAFMNRRVRLARLRVIFTLTLTGIRDYRTKEKKTIQNSELSVKRVARMDEYTGLAGNRREYRRRAGGYV